MKASNLLKISTLSVALTASINANADQQILDDLIVVGSSCIGQDCVNGESFGFDTLRLKENNLRIKAQDTSTTASFPSRDWQITFNDSTNGGANKFSIDDIDGSRTPFTIEAGAPSDSLYIEDSGQIGLGTNAPVADIHVKSGNTPTLRLEQDGSSGFTPQTWDLAGNEANFFVRDATNGSKLPFRIQPSSGSGNDNALYIASDGDIGMGTTSPSADLHVMTADDSQPNVIIENTNATDVYANSIELRNAGTTKIAAVNTSPGAGVPSKWNLQFRHEDGSVRITNNTYAGEEFQLSKEGNLNITGTITATGSDFSSSKLLKENFTKINSAEILDKISSLDILMWNYIKHDDAIKHIGPMSEDFHNAFGLNGDKSDKISVSDISGVSLAAIQALIKQVKLKDKVIADMQNRLKALENK